MHLILRSAELDLHTRRQHQVKNVLDLLPMHFGAQLQAADLRAKYSHATHREVAVSRKYNCHGLTFAARRTWIEDPSEIKKIIADDDYVTVERAKVAAGDVVVYYSNGDPEHSGIVVGADPTAGPLVLSKWGFLHEVVHWVPECPYDAGNVIFYRINS